MNADPNRQAAGSGRLTPRPARTRLGRLFSFAFAGGSGFVIDVGVLYLLMAATPLGPFAARIVSIGCAMASNYMINRIFTFGASDRPVVAEGAAAELGEEAGALLVGRAGRRGAELSDLRRPPAGHAGLVAVLGDLRRGRFRGGLLLSGLCALRLRAQGPG